MKDHFVKLKSFSTARKKYPTVETDPVQEFMIRVYTVINLADVLSYVPPNDADCVLFTNVREVEIDKINLTAIRLKTTVGNVSIWIDMNFDAFDKIFRGYLADNGVEYTDYATI